MVVESKGTSVASEISAPLPLTTPSGNWKLGPMDGLAPEESTLRSRPRRANAGNRMEEALAAMELEGGNKEPEEDDVDFVVLVDEQDVFDSDCESTDEEAEAARPDENLAVEDEEKTERNAAKTRLQRATEAVHARQRATFNPEQSVASGSKQQQPKRKPGRPPGRKRKVRAVSEDEDDDDSDPYVKRRGKGKEAEEPEMRKSSRKLTVQSGKTTKKRARAAENKRATTAKRAGAKGVVEQHVMTQAELLTRALDNEEGNIIDHRDYLRNEEEKRSRVKVVRATVEGPLIRWISRKEDVPVLKQMPPSPSPPTVPLLPVKTLRRPQAPTPAMVALPPPVLSPVSASSQPAATSSPYPIYTAYVPALGIVPSTYVYPGQSQTSHKSQYVYPTPTFASGSGQSSAASNAHPGSSGLGQEPTASTVGHGWPATAFTSGQTSSPLQYGQYGYPQVPGQTAAATTPHYFYGQPPGQPAGYYAYPTSRAYVYPNPVYTPPALSVSSPPVARAAKAMLKLAQLGTAAAGSSSTGFSTVASNPAAPSATPKPTPMYKALYGESSGTADSPIMIDSPPPSPPPILSAIVPIEAAASASPAAPAAIPTEAASPALPTPTPRSPTPAPVETQPMAKSYIIHELGQFEATPKPSSEQTLSAMLGPDVHELFAGVREADRETMIRTWKGLAPTGKDTCWITGLPARYMEPVSGVPFASMDAWKVLNGIVRHEYVWSAKMGCYVGWEGEF